MCARGRGLSFAGARLAEGNSPGVPVWIEGRVLLAGALRVVDIVLVEVPVPVTEALGLALGYPLSFVNGPLRLLIGVR